MSDVFISYSRKDKTFVEKLHKALFLRNRDTWIDWQNIPLTSDWWQQIEIGIEETDTFVFIISPDAVKSEVCYQEVQHAVKHHKRIVPLVYREIFSIKDVHPAINKHNWIFFRSQDCFEESLEALLTALDTDLAHVRTHTLILTRAIEWHRKQQNRDLLLRGSTLEESITWLTQSTDKHPKPTFLQSQYIIASQHAQAHEKKRWQELYHEAQKAQNKAECSEIDALISASKALLISNDQLNALRVAVKAGKRLLVTETSQQLKEQTAENLQEVLFKVAEANRFQSSGRILSVSLSPDGKLIAAGSDDKTLQLWTREGKCLKKLKEHSHAIISVCFSPDGKLLASGGADTTIKLWSDDGTLLNTLKGHKDHIWHLTFSPDSQILASAGFDHTILLWDCDGNLLRRFEIDGQRTFSVCFSPDSQMLASAHDDCVKLWKCDGTLLKTFSLNDSSQTFWSVQFSPDGHILAAGNAKGIIALWNLDGTLNQELEGHQAEVKSIIFNNTGEILISASWDKTIKVWHLDGRLLHTFKGHRAPVWGLSYDAQNDMIVSSSSDSTIRLWHLNSTFYTSLVNPSEVWKVSFSPNGQQIASTHKDNNVRIWNLEGKLLQTLKSHRAPTWGVSFSPDGQQLASTSWDKTIKLWNCDGQLLNTLNAHTREVTCICFSPDGKRLASAGEDGIKVWDRDGSLLSSFDGSESVYGLTFSPDGRMLASANADNTIKLWSLTGQVLQILGGHQSVVQDVNFSPDGQQIASSSADKTIKLWTVDGVLLHTLNGHTANVWAVKFSPNGQFLVSGSEDNSIKIWHRNGTLLQTLKGHTAAVWSVSFSPNGKILASGSWDNTIYLWNLERILDFSLEKLLSEGNCWLENYLKHNPTVNVLGLGEYSSRISTQGGN